jgi:ABC-type sugar transport system ATPase subunit
MSEHPIDLTAARAMPGPDLAPAEILSLVGISKAYGHVQALVDVDLDLRRGEILGIVGDNGAGKSTLMKVIAGGVRPDAGEIRVDGATAAIAEPADSRRLGIEMIYQDLALFDNLSVAANIFIGRETTVGRVGLLSLLRERQMNQRAAELLRRLRIGISSTRLLVEGLSGGQRQMVAIARAIAFESRILIMDEPSAALGSVESATVLELIRSLRGHGVSVIVISHRIPEVLDLADRILVMKRGRCVAVVDAAMTTVEACVNLIVSGQAVDAAGGGRTH